VHRVADLAAVRRGLALEQRDAYERHGRGS
jgi:hypothetical protein